MPDVCISLFMILGFIMIGVSVANACPENMLWLLAVIGFSFAVVLIGYTSIFVQHCSSLH